MKWRIAVLDPDIRYRDRFLAQWNAAPKEGVEIEWMTSLESFLEAHRDRRYDALLADENALDKKAKKQIERIAPQTDLFYWRDQSDEHGPAKYQPVSRTRRDLFHLLSCKRSTENPKDLGGQLIFCTALSGGLGVTTVTRALAMAYRRLFSDQHVFYYELKPFSTSEKFSLSTKQNATSSYTIADVVLAMRMPAADVDLRLAACTVEQNGVATLLPPHHAADFFDITKEEWVALFHAVKKRHSCVFLDCPPGWLWQFSSFFSVTDRLLLFSNGKEEDRLRAFLDLIPYTWKEGRDAFLERGDSEESGRAFVIPRLPEKEIESYQQQDPFATLSTFLPVEEVARWIHA